MSTIAVKSSTIGRSRGRALLALDEVLGLLRKAERVGENPSEILRRAQVPHTFEYLANGRPTLVTRRHLASIYRECIVAIGWHSSRMDSKRQMMPAEFRLMCYCVITATTLKEVIERQSLFFNTHSERISAIQLSVERGRATVTVDTLRRRRSFASFLSDLMGMSAFGRLYAWLVGIEDDRIEVGLAHGEQYANEAISEFFGGRLHFDQPVNQFVFPASLLDLPVMRTPSELDHLLVEFPFDFLSRRLASASMEDRLRSFYMMRLRRGEPVPSFAAIANDIGESVSTLRRRLAAEGASPRAIKDKARHAYAIELLSESRVKVEDLSVCLGFRDVDSFRAAFRRWTGGTPSQIRREGIPDRN